MRRPLWIGAALLVAVVAAIPLWLAVDEDGERRAAALQEPTGTGDIGRLTIAGRNGGNPIPIRSFSVELSRAVNRTSTKRDAAVLRPGPLEVLKKVDNTSAVLFEFGATNASADGKLEIGPDKPYLTYALKPVALEEWLDDANGERLAFGFAALTADLPAPPPTAPPAAVAGRMTIASLSKTAVPIIDFDTGFVREVQVELDGTLTFLVRKHRPVFVKRAIDTLAPQLLQSIQGTASVGDVKVELISPGTATPYATYFYSDVLLTKVADEGAAGSIPTQTIEFDYTQVEIKTAAGAASVSNGPSS